MTKQIRNPRPALDAGYESIASIVGEPETFLGLPTGWRPATA
jgi:hypothetical protein